MKSHHILVALTVFICIKTRADVTFNFVQGETGVTLSFEGTLNTAGMAPGNAAFILGRSQVQSQFFGDPSLDGISLGFV